MAHSAWNFILGCGMLYTLSLLRLMNRRLRFLVEWVDKYDMHDKHCGDCGDCRDYQEYLKIVDPR